MHKQLTNACAKYKPGSNCGEHTANFNSQSSRIISAAQRIPNLKGTLGLATSNRAGFPTEQTGAKKDGAHEPSEPVEERVPEPHAAGDGAKGRISPGGVEWEGGAAEGDETTCRGRWANRRRGGGREAGGLAKAWALPDAMLLCDEIPCVVLDVIGRGFLWFVLGLYGFKLRGGLRRHGCVDGNVATLDLAWVERGCEGLEPEGTGNAKKKIGISAFLEMLLIAVHTTIDSQHFIRHAIGLQMGHDVACDTLSPSPPYVGRSSPPFHVPRPSCNDYHPPASPPVRRRPLRPRGLICFPMTYCFLETHIHMKKEGVAAATSTCMMHVLVVRIAVAACHVVTARQLSHGLHWQAWPPANGTHKGRASKPAEDASYSSTERTLLGRSEG
nr:unnamed protein product [Digitaria exilis]